MDIGYVSDPAPGIGYLPPRSTLDSDAPSIALAGRWRFRLHERADDGDDGFPDPGYDDSGWDTITVPGHWQLSGQDNDRYGRPAYTNLSYPFPIDPPHVPDANPTGDYRVGFDLPADWPRQATVLRFDGVDSCFVVWLNGVRLGHATGSRLACEFDAGSALVAGRNVIAVRVHQWSAGSYLEDQDMWWLSGIFRDVTLVSRPSIEDVFVHADYADGVGTLRIDVTGAPARLSVPDLGIVDADVRDGSLTCAGVRPWSAEDPHLYPATLTSDAETVRLRIGFRSISTDGGVLTVNGRPITLRGVNRHEFDPDHGRTLDLETMRTDVLLMKQHNINAVRTSHYPPHPRFLDLCDELGLWVIDECDLETHGFTQVGWRGNPSDDEAWRPAIVDRMRRTLERDKNHPCVIMWSLGNEAGTGSGLAAAAEWIAGRDPSRPRHYEGDRASTYVDVYSRMYPTHAEVTRIGSSDDDAPGLPFVMCEYAHAMGNGPGGLADYQAIIDAYPRCAGGFIWEWIDHGLRRPDGSFGYGGDFGEELHDGNFVCDGLLFPDRTPSPALADVAAVFAPVRIRPASNNRVRIDNRYDFHDLSHLRFDWTLEAVAADVPGRMAMSAVIATGSLDVPPIAAGGHADIDLPTPADLPKSTDLPTLAGLPPPTDHPTRADLPSEFSIDRYAEAWFTIRATLVADTSWAPAGHEIASGQVMLGEPVVGHPIAGGSGAGGSGAGGSGSGSGIGAGSGSVVQGIDAGRHIQLGPGRFDARTGSLIRVADVDLDGPTIDMWRAPTDNDIGAKLDQAWRAIGLHRLHQRVVGVERSADALVVTVRVAAAATDLAYLCTLRWTADDRLHLDLTGTPVGTWPCPLPRFGVRFALPAEFNRVEWFGFGPGEAYRDARSGVRLGRYAASVDELQTPYVRPQENGNRMDVRSAAFTDAGGRGIGFGGAPTFDFTARRWTSADLDAAQHTKDLQPGRRIYVNLDAAHHGIGSASCGPGPLPPYRLEASQFHLRLAIDPQLTHG